MHAPIKCDPRRDSTFSFVPYKTIFILLCAFCSCFHASAQEWEAYKEYLERLDAIGEAPELNLTHKLQSLAQSENDPCGHSHFNPEVHEPENQRLFERKFAELLEKQKHLSKSRSQVTMQIPVVVHVIHQGDAVGQGENISQAQIESQIRALNDAFNRTPGTRYASPDNNAGLDYNVISKPAEIEFVLATVDPDGNPTNGINRVQTIEGYHKIPDFIDNIIKPATIWAPEYYMNFWSCRLTDGFKPGLLGYAVFPTMSGLEGLFSSNTANTDGIVCDFRTVGSNEYGAFDLNTSYQYGVTAIHEVGHFLGLRHIWGDGDEETGCDIDDYVDDTPNAAVRSFGCAANESCGSIDLSENYMDYGSDVCKNIFTNGQILRMLTVLNNSPRRASLVTSPVLTGSPIPMSNIPTNDLCISAISVQCGDNIKGATLRATNTGAFSGLDGRLCSGEAATQGVWYKLEGAGDEILLSTTEAGTDYDATIHVFAGECDDLECIGGNDDQSTQALNTGSDLRFLAEDGVTYFIYISGKEGETGNYQLKIECTSFDASLAPENDRYQNAMQIQCGDAITGATNGSSIDAIGSGACGVDLSDKGVWYSYVGTGELVTVSTCTNFTFDTKLAVFDGFDSFLGCFANNDNGGGCSDGSEKKFFGVEGEEYLIWIGGSAQGNFTLTLSCEPAPEAPINVNFSQQGQIDTFFLTYPNTTEIVGDVIISHDLQSDRTIIHDLTPLKQLTKIGGSLTIESNIWDAFSSLEGLENLVEIGGDLVVRSNAALKSLSPLSNLTYIGGALVVEGYSLDGFDGLQNVTYVGGDMDLNGAFVHKNKFDLRDLSAIQSIGGDIQIHDYHSMDTVVLFPNVRKLSGNLLLDRLSTSVTPGTEVITGFTNVETMEGNIEIYACRNLKNIENVFPMLRNISGDIKMRSNPELTKISNNSFSILEEIEGDLSIAFCADFSDLADDSFQSLKRIGGKMNLVHLFLQRAQLKSLEMVGDSLIMNSALGDTSYIDLLPSILRIDGPVIMDFNLQVASLNILSNCKQIDGDILLSKFNLAKEISGFDELELVKGSIEITENSFTEELKIFRKLSELEGSISFTDNVNLLRMEAFDNLEKIGGDFGMYMSFKSFSGASPVVLGSLNHLQGNMYIGRTGLTSLSMPSLNKISGDFIIDRFNFDLDTLDFSSLHFIEGDFVLDSSGFTNMNGFEKLTKIGGDLLPSKLLFSSTVTNIEEIGGNLILDSLLILDNLRPFNSLKKIGNNLVVNGLPRLESLEGFEELSEVGGRIEIVGNPALSDCYSLCTVLNSSQDTSVITVKDNALGCDDFTDLFMGCQATPTFESQFQDIITVGPNPFNDFIEISTESISFDRISLIDQLGGIDVLSIQPNTSNVEWNAKSLLPGIYTISIELSNGVTVLKRIIKQ